ncbi:ABC transporter family substrate-binding protein [Jatrophihabitans telluris]|uniref:ABC transporter family substrate-binding protein n=1 Tax=Jatrophihabitans telluris TaxID=2038343 RepID=A0ABY4R3A3_9ACTN|nr:ABC transporter family substrate-binding protein [Jatrophihabitans telluris]UQX90323.1 ABC transporter family substrate-binding protein [Jatrophihabitans telluris]
MKVKASVAAIAVASIALTACGSSNNSSKGGSTTNKGQASATTNAVNAVPYAQVPTGGTMRWPITGFPVNFNILQVDGNESDTSDLMTSTLPQLFNFDAGGKAILNTAVADKAEQTSSSPQTIQYHLNPKAVWSDGTPITYKDFVAQWQADNGTNAKFLAASTSGYDQVKSVVRGATDQDVTVVFNTPYSEWQSLWSTLLPASLMATPDAYNKSWANGPTVSGGPFKIGSIDKTAKTITMVHNDKWWGNPAKLDKIQFITISDTTAQAKALQSDQVDFVDVGSDIASFQVAKSVQNVELRKAGGPNWRHIDLGKSGALADVSVRQAIMLSLDRKQDAQTLLGPLSWPSTLLNSHVWVNNQAQYKETCSDFCNRDITKADALLTKAGYTKGSDGIFAKNGKPLALGFTIPQGVKSSADEGAIQQKALQEAGIKLTLKVVPTDTFFSDYIAVGKFDLTIFSWIGNPFPLSGTKQLYEAKGESNFSKIGSQALDDLINKMITATDPAEAVNLSYQVDKMVWDEGHSVPLYQRPELIFSKKTLENFGAFGFANKIYENIGFKA